MWAAVAAAGVGLVGTAVATSANAKAAKGAAAADLQGAQIQSNAIDKQIAAIRQGVQEGSQKYQAVQATTAPRRRRLIAGRAAVLATMAPRHQPRRRLRRLRSFRRPSARSRSVDGGRSGSSRTSRGGGIG